MSGAGGGAAAAAGVLTVDGTVLPVEEARKLAQRYWYGGFAGLPMLWAVNAALFWPQLWGGAAAGENRPPADLHVRRYALRSAVGCALVAAVLVPWMLAFIIDGERLVGTETYERLAITKQARVSV